METTTRVSNKTSSVSASDNKFNINSVQQQESSKVEEVGEAEEMNFSEDQQLSDDVRELIEIKFNPKKATWSKIPLGLSNLTTLAK